MHSKFIKDNDNVQSYKIFIILYFNQNLIYQENKITIFFDDNVKFFIIDINS